MVRGNLLGVSVLGGGLGVCVQDEDGVWDLPGPLVVVRDGLVGRYTTIAPVTLWHTC